jgi:hypothetical protein
MTATPRASRITVCIAMVLALAVGCGGCATITSHWPRILSFSEPPKLLPVAPDTSIESSGLPPDEVRRLQTHEPASRKRPHTGSAARTSISDTTAPAKAPSTAPLVTLAGETPDSEATRRLLDQTDRQLAEVDRGKLDVQDGAAYDQVKGFLKAGRHALDEQDYLTAAGYAQKASSLASRLPPTL